MAKANLRRVLASVANLLLSGLFVTAAACTGLSGSYFADVDDDCTPSCAEECGVPDGCGKICRCPDGHVQDADGKWIPKDQCHDTCVAAGWACGTMCGESCGTCANGTSCVDRFCLGAPPRANAAQECSLSLSVVGSEVRASQRLSEVAIALESMAQSAQLLDIQVRADRPMQVIGARFETDGENDISAFMKDAEGHGWSVLSSRSARFVIRPPAPREGTKVLVLKIVTDPKTFPRLWIERRAGTLAPLEADAELQGCAYDAPVAISL